MLVNIACSHCNHSALLPLEVLPKPVTQTTCPKCRAVMPMYHYIISGAANLKIPELMITYIDSDGSETNRDISEIKYKNSYVFNAYCHLRKAERTFYVNRVMEAINIATGSRVLNYNAKWGDKGRTRLIQFEEWIEKR